MIYIYSEEASEHAGNSIGDNKARRLHSAEERGQVGETSYIGKHNGRQGMSPFSAVQCGFSFSARLFPSSSGDRTIGRGALSFSTTGYLLRRLRWDTSGKKGRKCPLSTRGNEFCPFFIL